MNDYTTTFTVSQSPAEVFAAINDVGAWWGSISGSTEALGDEFTYKYEDVHVSTQRITEFVPESRVAWAVVDSFINHAEDKTEWNGTEITFDIAPVGDQTEVRFTHLGLVPEIECFDNCSSAWSYYVNSSLRSLITTGQGAPNT